jgi:hypothetical protein
MLITLLQSLEDKTMFFLHVFSPKRSKNSQKRGNLGPKTGHLKIQQRFMRKNFTFFWPIKEKFFLAHQGKILT